MAAEFLSSESPSLFSALKGLRDIVASHLGSESTKKSEPLLHTVLGRFDSVLGGAVAGEDETTEAVKREKSTDWGLLLTDTLDFIDAHKGLIQDGTSQALKVDQDIRILIDIAHTQATKGGVNDKTYLVGLPFAWKLRGR
jgi:hypothetical protein